MGILLLLYYGVYNIHIGQGFDINTLINNNPTENTQILVNCHYIIYLIFILYIIF